MARPAALRTASLLCALAAACAAPAEPPAPPAPPTQTVFGGARPTTLRVPADYDHARGAPLVLLLHGYGATGLMQETYFKFDELVDEAGVLLLAPDGTVDQAGNRFWSALEGCCDFYRTGVDDVAYLSGLVAEVRAVWNVDPRRIYAVGHSNGGFMANRLACEKADVFAAILSLAGAAYNDPSSCRASRPVSMLDLHGTADPTVRYDGDTDGALLGRYPGALATVAHWAAKNGCTGGLAEETARLDLDGVVPGAETQVRGYGGCPAGVGVELWSMQGSSHLPGLRTEFRARGWEWLNAHARP